MAFPTKARSLKYWDKDIPDEGNPQRLDLHTSKINDFNINKKMQNK